MKSPNILILHADQLRYDGLGCNGNAHARTPHIDAIAAEGSVFTRHIAANPICMPSRASFFTGLYPSGHNVWSNGVPLSRDRDTGPVGSWPLPPGARSLRTLADVFSAGGYDTASFGKLHLTPNRSPLEYGGAENWALMDIGGLRNWHGPYYGFRHVEMTKGHAEEPCQSGHYADWLEAEHPEIRARALGTKATSAYPLPERRDIYASPVPSECHHSLWLADRFADYLHARPANQPFFAFVGFPDPHHAFTPSHDIAAQFENAPVREPGDPEGLGWRNCPMREQLERHHCISNLDAEERRVIIRYTYAMIHTIDLAVGRITAALKAHGLWENTVIVVTSDHGDFLCDHALLYKASVGSNSLLRVPFVLRAPGCDLPSRVDRVMSNCDVLPTLAALAGLQQPTGIHGRDILPVIREARSHIAMAQCFTGDPAGNNITVYDDRYRLTWWPEHQVVELFNHIDDPEEIHDIADCPETATVRLELLECLKEQTLRHTNPILSKLGGW
jgi:arylsulfatase A-like enzyme